MLNHCLNRRAWPREQCHPLKLGNIESYILSREAHCLWELLGQKKYSGVKTVSRHASSTIKKQLQNMSQRFQCSEEELLIQIKKSQFQSQYYRMVNSNRG